jgi:predicted Zn-dependent protease
VYVGGAEAFVSGTEPTRESLLHAAQAAVTVARGLKAISKPARPLAPAPSVTGEWAVPVDIDPFSISPEDHCAVTGGLGSNHGQGHGANWVDVEVNWTAETRVFASSEGSLVTQRFTRCLPTFGVRGKTWRIDWIGYRLPMFAPCSAGFEYLLRPRIHDQVHEAVAELEELLRIPNGYTDVGRKEVVMDGYAHAAVVGAVLLPALSLGRALGEEQDHAGTSLFAPPETMLGQTVGTPLLNLRVPHWNAPSTSSAVPNYGAAQWDDEGVATAASPLIQHGVLMDYFGTRHNRQALSPSSTLCGTATAFDVQRTPSDIPTATEIEAPATGESLATLARNIGDGFLLREVTGVMTDQQCAGGTIEPNVLLEVRRGQILRRIMDVHVAFTTKKLWTGLTAVGNATTSRTEACNDLAGPPPWKLVRRVVTAPAAHFKEVNIVSRTGGRR